MKRFITAVILFLLLTPPTRVPAQQEYSLAAIIQLGVENNPLLRSRAMEVEAGRAAYRTSRLLFNPSLDFDIGRGESWDGTVRRNTGGISMSQYLENPLKRHYRIQMSESEWKAAEYSLSSLQLDVIYGIKQHFHLILFLQMSEELAARNLSSLEAAHRLVASRVRAGETRELEAIKLDVEVMKARNDLKSVQTELRLAGRHLNALLGNVLPAGYTLEGELAFHPLELEESYLTGRALQVHPLLGRSERMLDYARDRLRYTRSSLLPDPRISGFVSDGLDGRVRGIGISLQLPFWNLKSREVAESKSLSSSMEFENESLRLEISTEVAIRTGRLRLSEERIELFRTGLLRQAEESLRISETSYRQGEISLIDYLDSQRTYNSILSDYYDSLYTWNVDKASLERAIGEEIR